LGYGLEREDFIMLSLEDVGLACLVVGAVTYEIRRNWQGEAKMAEPVPVPVRQPSFWRRAISYVPLLLILSGATIVIYKQIVEQDGFTAGWPDAIRCHTLIPNGGNQNLVGDIPSDLIFYLDATLGVGRLGKVVRYDYIAGIGQQRIINDSGLNVITPQMYTFRIVNELWFVAEGRHAGDRVFPRRSIPEKMEAGESQNDLVIRSKPQQSFDDKHNDDYEKSFAENNGWAPVCGKDDSLGDSITEIKDAKNAFVFARPFK
jgi:hypothetical protein